MTMSRFHFYSPESCVKVASMEDMQWRKLDVEERLQKEQQGRAAVDKQCTELRAMQEADAKQCDTYRDALSDLSENMAKSVQLLVTVPKVHFNLGGKEHNSVSTVPFKQIQQALHEEMLPKFKHVTAVADQHSDATLKDQVKKSLQELAVKLQEKIHLLCPQAEGTVSWDGFGSKGASLDAP
jgi:hypothetical protein